MRPLTRRGINIIEMIALIVVLSIAIPPLLTMWSETSRRSVRTEAIADATFYAQELMEEIKSKKFDENDSSPWSSVLGVDSGEVSGNRTTFDDVDDFNGYSDQPSGGYVRNVNVEYVLVTDNTWEVCASPSCTDVIDCNTCDQCCYKRITIYVSRPNLIGNVTLVTVVAGY
jgi:type II secretory pathway pseudopilin PulG